MTPLHVLAALPCFALMLVSNHDRGLITKHFGLPLDPMFQQFYTAVYALGVAFVVLKSGGKTKKGSLLQVFLVAVPLCALNVTVFFNLFTQWLPIGVLLSLPACALTWLLAFSSIDPWHIIQVPGLGWVLYQFRFSVSSNSPFMDSSIWKEPELAQARPGDVTLVQHNGLHYILHQLREKGDGSTPDQWNTGILDVVSWPEFVYYPGQTNRERVEYLDSTQWKEFSFRIMKVTNWFYKPQDELQPGMKYVWVHRSMYSYLNSIHHTLGELMNPRLKQLWGDFPGGQGFNTHTVSLNFLKRNHMWIWGNIAEYVRRTRDTPEQFYRFDEVNWAKNPKQELEALAKWLGLDIPEVAWPKILAKTDPQYMLRHKLKFDYKIPMGPLEGESFSQKGMTMSHWVLGCILPHGPQPTKEEQAELMRFTREEVPTLYPDFRVNEDPDYTGGC